MRNLKLRSFALLLTVFALVAAACSDEPEPGGTGRHPAPPARRRARPRSRTCSRASRRTASSGSRRTRSTSRSPGTTSRPASGRDSTSTSPTSRQPPRRRRPRSQHQEWDLVTAGSWNDRWDMNVGSMTVTMERPRSSPSRRRTTTRRRRSSVFTATTPRSQDLTTDLDGKKVCVGSSTTYEDYVQEHAEHRPAHPFDYVIDDPQIITFATDTDALDNLALGDGVRCDAAMTAPPTIEQFIADGGPIKVVGDPLYGEPLCDRVRQGRSPIDNASLVEAVSQIIDDMHADGTLTALSMKWYGGDGRSSARSDPPRTRIAGTREHCDVAATGPERPRLPARCSSSIPQADFQLFAAWAAPRRAPSSLLFLPILSFTTDCDSRPATSRCSGSLGVVAWSAGGLLYISAPLDVVARAGRDRSRRRATSCPSRA